MIFITGARYSGKREFALESLHLTEADLTACEVQELVRECEDVDSVFESLRNEKVVIASEVGCGVVPLDKGERLYRERAGELSQRLANEADTVVRIVCGLPQVIKGQL